MILLIDGRSGSGKTVLADMLAGDLGATVVHMDDLYEGWHGLQAAALYAVRQILEPLSLGEPARWQRWDWAAGTRAEWHELPAGSSLVLEGCGSLTRASRELADRAIWLACDETTRRARALARDGDDSWWQMWREQEDRLIALEQPRSLADEVRDCA